MNNVKEINKFSNHENYLLLDEREKIRKELIVLEYDFANIGSLYLLDVIEFICKSDNYIQTLLNLEKNVYIHIAKIYNKNVKTLKSDIAKATKKMYETRCFKYPNEKDNNLTPKTVINSVVDKMKSTKIFKQKTAI